MHGGGVGGLLQGVGVAGMDVGEQFISARSASWSTSDGAGRSKEKLRKRVAMVVVVVSRAAWRGWTIQEQLRDQQQCLGRPSVIRRAQTQPREQARIRATGRSTV